MTRKYDPDIPKESPEMMAVIEFDDPKIIKGMVNGAEFKALSEQRPRVFTKLNRAC